MTSRFPLSDKRLRSLLALMLSATTLALLLTHWAVVHAQGSDQIIVYSAQTTYAAAMLDIQGHEYVGLVELLEPR